MERDRVIDPTVKVNPSSVLTLDLDPDPPISVVILTLAGKGVNSQVEREVGYVISPDEADRIARQLNDTADLVRSQQAKPSGGNGG